MSKKKGIGIKLALMLFGFVPFLTVSAALTITGVINIRSKVENGVFEKLKVASINVGEYFAYDIRENGYVDYDEYSDYTYFDSLKEENIDLTLFKGNTRYLTSLFKEDGKTRNEGTTASDAVWAAVSSGQYYKSSDVVINGVDYYVYYCPIYDSDNNVWGMSFAGESQESVKETENQAILSFIIIVAVLVVVFSVIILLLANKIAKALQDSTKSLKVLAQGRLGENIEIRSNVREIGEIADSLKDLQDKLQTTVGGTMQTALTLNDTAATVDDLSENSAAGTSQIAEAIGELSVTAQSMAETVQDANTSVLEMGNAIEKINENAGISARDAADMKTANSSAVDAITRVGESNRKSVEAINTISEYTRACSDSVEQIKKAAEVISNIASQTNLLALNASIEAARAGEAGKGFAVVADSIKSLATESSNSATEIGNYVADIVDKVDKCVDASEDAAKLMKEQNELVSTATLDMDRLSASVESVASNISAISEGTAVLDKAKESVLSNISDLSAISEENAASAQEVSASVEGIASAVEETRHQSGSMRKLAEEMDEQMSYFKL